MDGICYALVMGSLISEQTTPAYAHLSMIIIFHWIALTIVVTTKNSW